MTDILSTVYTATAPTWLGVYLHDPASPETTELGFLYGNIGRGEALGVDVTFLKLLGRARPVAEYGEAETTELSLSTFLPFGADHDAAVQWWRDRVRARATLCYRDGRKRLEYVSLGKVGATDARAGTTVAATVTTVDYSEAV